MNKIMKNLLLLLSFAVIGFSTVSAQDVTTPDIEEATSSVTLKTLRALFPDQPVAVANELYGGMHSVQDVSDLLTIDQAKLQVGMLVSVQDTNMIFRYVSANNSNLGVNDGDLNQGAYGENTDNWESLADMLLNTAIRDSIGAQIGDSLDLLLEMASAQVFTDTTVDATRPFIEGDIAILGDTSFVYDEGWMILADNRVDSVAYADGIATTGPTQTDAVSGDMVLDTAGGFVTTYVYDGADWTVISVLDTTVEASVDSFQVYFASVSDPTSITALLAKVEGQEAFRALFDGTTNLIVDAEVVVDDKEGVVIYYPAAWGDFTYSLNISGTTYIEMTNGISTATVDEPNSGTSGVKYKAVTIRSREYPVLVQ